MSTLGTMIRAYTAPYMMWIKRLAVAAVAGFLFVSGCNYGKNRNEADTVRLSGQVQALALANREFKDAAEQAKLDAAAAVKTAKEKQKAAEEADKRAEKTREFYEKKAKTAGQRLGDALKDPKCKDLLEMKVCSTIPIP